MAEPALVVRGPAKRGDDFVEAARGLVVATMLEALAGMVDVIGYLHLKGLFVSFMSGNSTQLAAALGRGDLGGAATIAELVALFVLGAAAGQMLADFTGRWHTTCVLIGVALVLAIAAVLATTPDPMVFAMGALNASMHRCSGPLRPRSRQSPSPAGNRVGLARTSRPLGRNDRWRDDRQRRLCADRRARNLGSDRIGRRSCGWLHVDPAARLTVRSGSLVASAKL